MARQIAYGLDLLAHAQLHIGQTLDRAQQGVFHVVLLQIDEAGVLLVLHGQHVELIDRLFAIAPEDLAHIPGHAFFQQFLAHTQPVKDVQ